MQNIYFFCFYKLKIKDWLCGLKEFFVSNFLHSKKGIQKFTFLSSVKLWDEESCVILALGSMNLLFVWPHKFATYFLYFGKKFIGTNYEKITLFHSLNIIRKGWYEIRHSRPTTQSYISMSIWYRGPGTSDICLCA